MPADCNCLRCRVVRLARVEVTESLKPVAGEEGYTPEETDAILHFFVSGASYGVLRAFHLLVEQAKGEGFMRAQVCGNAEEFDDREIN